MGHAESGDERYRVVTLDDVEPLVIGDDLMLPLRRLLGVSAFGLNAFVGREAGDTVIGTHDELGGYAAGHEEAYIVLRGSAIAALDGETFDAPAGTILFARDPAVKRGVVAAAPDTVVLVIGGARGEPYRPGAWEYGYVAANQATREDWPGADRTLAEGLALHPASAELLYNRACYASLAGDVDAALALLSSAHEVAPDTVRAWASDDTDLDRLRDHPRWPLAS